MEITRQKIKAMKAFDKRRKLHKLNKARGRASLTSLAIFGINLIGLGFNIIPANKITGIILTLSLLGIIIPMLLISESQSGD